MTVLERKTELIKAILNDMDENTFEKLECVYYNRPVQTEITPCQYSPEELNERARQAIEDVKAGRVVPHEIVRKRFMP
jgi:hypothetical protein